MASRTLKARNFELQVATRLQAAAWLILYHDVRIRGIQVDLVARDPQGVLSLIEVKSQTSSDLAHLSFQQKARLFRVAEFLAEWEPVTLKLAFIQSNRVQLLPVDGLTGG